MVDLCLTIGVSRAQHLAELSGAITAAHEMSDWAQQSGFITEMITDEGDNPVTITRIREKLLSMLPENDEVGLFILHFAGHGFRTGAEQNVWLPTDWYREMRAISVEGLKKQLYRHGIKNLSIFSDACRTLPGDIETADIAQDPILPRGPYDPIPPIIDRFNAVMDGNQAYMLQGDTQSPPRCIFSTVLIEGLCGLHEEAFDEYIPDCVIPESLALFSQKRMKEIGSIYRLTCSPDSITGIPRRHAVYFERGRKLSGNIVNLRWPEPHQAHSQNTKGDSYSDLDNDTGHDSDDIQDSYGDIEYFDLPSKISVVAKKHFSISRNLNHEIFSAIAKNATINLIVRGCTPIQVWSTVESLKVKECDFIFTLQGNDAVQVLVEFPDGVFMSAVVYDQLITVLHYEEKGVNGWFCVEPYFADDSLLENFINSITDFQLGNVTAGQVDRYAANITNVKTCKSYLWSHLKLSLRLYR